MRATPRALSPRREYEAPPLEPLARPSRSAGAGAGAATTSKLFAMCLSMTNTARRRFPPGRLSTYTGDWRVAVRVAAPCDAAGPLLGAPPGHPREEALDGE